MSYCRFSSMNWMCDVYTYESVYGGWTTHVAGSRRAFAPIPDILSSRRRLPRFGVVYPDPKNMRLKTFPTVFHRLAHWLFYSFVAFWHNKIHMKTLHLIPLRSINLPHAGETFNDPTPDACADRLEWLRSLGFNVPQYAIDRLRQEHKDMLNELAQKPVEQLPVTIGPWPSSGESQSGTDPLDHQ